MRKVGILALLFSAFIFLRARCGRRLQDFGSTLFYFFEGSKGANNGGMKVFVFLGDYFLKIWQVNLPNFESL